MQFVKIINEYESDLYGVIHTNEEILTERGYINCGYEKVDIDEKKVPKDIHDALEKALKAEQKYMLAKTNKGKMKNEYDKAIKELRSIGESKAITLQEFIKEFFRNIPANIRQMIHENYKVATNFSDTDFSSYDEFEKLSNTELTIKRKVVIADTKYLVKKYELNKTGEETHVEDIDALRLRCKALEANTKALPIIHWKGEHYLKKEKIGQNEEAIVIHDDYIIPISDMLTKSYANKLANLFINTDGSMAEWHVCSKAKKKHATTWHII